MSVFLYQVYQTRLQEHLLNRKPCRAIQHAFSKLSLENLITNEANLVISFQVTSDYDVIIDFRVDSTSMTTLIKKCNVMMT